MMNIRIDDRHAYVEVEVFGRYQLERMPELLSAMRDLADRHGHFSELEIHHGKPDNLLKAMSKLSQASGNPEEYAFMQKMRKYALVSDNPALVIRLAASFRRLGSIEMRIFPMHERDHARQWIEEPVYNYQPAGGER